MSGPAGNPNDAAGKARQEVGDRSSSSRHPPHVSENDSDAQIQRESASGKDIPVMPANASGTDKVSSTTQDQEIDAESMYDRRPGENKNRPPTGST